MSLYGKYLMVIKIKLLNIFFLVSLGNINVIYYYYWIKK